MTEPGEDEKPARSKPLLRLNLGWLRWSLSWKAALGAVVALGAAVVIFVVVGGIDISADAPDGPLATNGLHFVFKRSVASGANRVTAPADLAAPSRVRLGAQHFDMVCANCHGRPGFGQSVTALSMSPRPQYLPKVVGQFTDAELYVIVEHGVKYSAMPSWATDARGDEVWSMVAFLRQLPKMDAAAYRAMTTVAVGGGTGLMSAGGDAVLRPANALKNAPPADEFLYAAPAAGFSDSTIHDNPAGTCARCHSPDGSGAATGGEAPNLTLQDATYLKAALQAYVAGGRKSGFMQTVAAQLSDGQIQALSNYYAGLPVQATPSAPADPAVVKRGETIALQGLRESAVPACATCHESAGGQIMGAPHIAGQSEVFLRRQLTAMRHGRRGSAVMWNPMPAVAHELADADIAALAAYYSGLKPSKGSSVAQSVPQAPPVKDLAATKAIFDDRCTKCHLDGGLGDRQGDYPNLTIQTAGYASQTLYAFHSGARPNNKMKQLVDSLSLDQLTSLGAYVGALAPRPALVTPDRTAALRGEMIATKGIAGRGVPACVGCHEAKGIAALPLIPTLQGQNAVYLNKRLSTFATSYLTDRSALNPMPAIARRLKSQEIADLAAYFAATPPLQKTSVRP